MPLITVNELRSRLAIGETLTDREIEMYMETALAQASEYLKRRGYNLSQFRDAFIDENIIIPMVTELYEYEHGFRSRLNYEPPTLLQASGAQRNLDGYIDDNSLVPTSATIEPLTHASAVSLGGLAGTWRYDSAIPLERGSLNWSSLTRTIQVHQSDLTGGVRIRDIERLSAGDEIRLIQEQKQVHGEVESVSTVVSSIDNTKYYTIVLADGWQTNLATSFRDNRAVQMRTSRNFTDNIAQFPRLQYVTAFPRAPVVDQRVQIVSTITDLTGLTVRDGVTPVTTALAGDVYEFREDGSWERIFSEAIADQTSVGLQNLAVIERLLGLDTSGNYPRYFGWTNFVNDLVTVAEVEAGNMSNTNVIICPATTETNSRLFFAFPTTLPEPIQIDLRGTIARSLFTKQPGTLTLSNGITVNVYYGNFRVVTSGYVGRTGSVRFA